MRFNHALAFVALFGAAALFSGCGNDENTDLFTLHVPVTSQTAPATTADVKFEIVLTNNTASALDLTWDRTVNNIPRQEGWLTAFCDNELCYPPTTNTNTFTVAANATDTLSFHYYPNGFVGTGTATVEIFQTTDRAGTMQSVTTDLTTN